MCDSLMLNESRSSHLRTFTRSRSRSPVKSDVARPWSSGRELDYDITANVEHIISYSEANVHEFHAMSNTCMDAGASAPVFHRHDSEIVGALARTDHWPFSSSSAGMDAAVSDLLTSKVDLDARDEDGHSALLLAAADRNGASAVRRLLAAHADVQVCDCRGASALLWAVGFGGNVEIVQTLIVERADIEAKDSDGLTPLMAASQSGCPTIVQTLLEARAHTDLSGALASSAAGSALDLAQAAGHQQIVSLLLNAA